jgi:Protein of unknown function (DUF3606)
MGLGQSYPAAPAAPAPKIIAAVIWLGRSVFCDELSLTIFGAQEPRVHLKRLRFLESDAMLTRPEKPTRCHIERKHLKHWAKHLNATPDRLWEVIEKVGNSVAAVEKELKSLAAKI